MKNANKWFVGIDLSGPASHLRYLLIESIQWVCQIPRYREAFERAVAKHGKNIARILVARMLLRSLFKMLKDKVRFNQVPAMKPNNHSEETATTTAVSG
jgi:hypothetical protein